MALIQIKSTNPNISWVIEKNPATGMILKSLRQGTLFGWFSQENNSAYNILFRDGQDEVSYKQHEDEEFEYLNVSRYNSAILIVNAIDEFFKTAFKKINAKDLPDAYINSLFINMINIKNERYLNFFNEYFKEFEIVSKNIVATNYQITINTKKPIHDLLNFSVLFVMFCVVSNEEPIFFTEDIAKKYLSCVNIIDAPYFVRYLFKIRFIGSPKAFLECKNILGKSSKDKIEMTFGSTWDGRKDFVMKHLSLKNNIIDLGCGEGRYITSIAGKMPDKTYIAIDTDEEILKTAQRRVENKQLENVLFYKSLDEYIDIGYSDSDTEVILSEVIEHMSEKEAENLVIQVLNLDAVKKVIITTPNSDFNINYFALDAEQKLRHQDHKWEKNADEFGEFIKECVMKSGKSYEVKFHGVSDAVNGVYCTSGCVLSR